MTHRFLLSLMTIVVAGLGFGSTASAQDSPDFTQIRSLIENYVIGWREGDAKRLSRVFDLDTGTIMWISGDAGDQKLESMTFGAVVARGKVNPDYGLQWDILSLDVVGADLAVARVRISRKGGSYTDVLVCQKINDAWRIVNKTLVLE